ncbi:beta-lactamase family protein [Lentibacter algarum]|uniref:serine hydrolase domain-containing protein n=1 Tax=Lentibacter algarum TaxID=576131 RepID=UPI001C08A6BE|nr:serine hydrolase domain-containing protein [Lentibacter algarum]MBU2982894.1 beta-lactamase family protein [Lentibacter algarum]
MLRLFLLAFSLVTAFTAVPVAAQDSATIARIESTFRAWASELGADRGTLAVTYKGRVVHEAGLNMNARAPVEIASLSKAITAVCVKRAVDSGKLRYNSRIGPLLSKRITFATPKLEQITVAQLLTHTAGLGPDATQRSMVANFRAAKPQHWQDAQAALGRKRQTKRAGKVFYNNENYAILGAVIEVATGRSYASYCAPKGARPSKLSRGFLPFGGWQMSAADYARFFAKNFGQGAIAKQPNAFPNARYLKPTRYGMGAFYRRFGKGFNFWHVGAFCMPGQMNAAAWAVHWTNGYGVTLSVNHCPKLATFGRLDKAMVKAVFR